MRQDADMSCSWLLNVQASTLDIEKIHRGLYSERYCVWLPQGTSPDLDEFCVSVTNALARFTETIPLWDPWFKPTNENRTLVPEDPVSSFQ